MTSDAAVARTAPTLASPEEAQRFFAGLDVMLETLAQRVARVQIAGDVNAEQAANLQFALFVVDGLRAIFQAERLK